jgi:hypothetical protein
MGTETDPKDFISSVLAIAKETYGSGAIYIPRYRAVKLVCLVADDLGFDGVSRGWYKFGLYSFLVDKIVKKTFKTARNLSDVQITQVCVNDDLKFKIRKTILGLKKNFLQSRENFGDWIH